VSTESDEKLNREHIHEMAEAMTAVAVQNAQQTTIMAQVEKEVASLSYVLRGNGKPGLLEVVATNGRRIEAMESRWEAWDKLVNGVKQHIGKAVLAALTLAGTVVGGQIWYTVTATRANAVQNQQIIRTLAELQERQTHQALKP
jgi:hypothetical protein